MLSFELTDQSESFQGQLRASCLEALESRISDFASLMECLEGADPVLVARVLEQIAEGDGHVGAGALSLLAEVRHSSSREPPTHVPVPHPLDYAWRFTRHTLDELLKNVQALSRPGDRVVHLGTPTLHEHALTELDDREHLLLDADARQVARANSIQPGSALHIDLLGPNLPEVSATCCVADPPWYPEYAAAFANAAALALVPGGSLLLAFAGAQTRPGIAHDRACVISGALEDGLELISARKKCRYETPPFEYAAMTAAGLSVPHAWRVGELFHLRRRAESRPGRRTARRESWHAVDLQGIPLRLRTDTPPHGAELIAPLIDGDVLPTVSRRAVVRDRVSLWTSRNRVFASADPPRLFELATTLARGDEPLPEDRATAAALHSLVAIECREHQISEKSSENGAI
jgi:hypothetical protein